MTLPEPLHPAASETLELSVTGGNTLVVLKPLPLKGLAGLVTGKLNSPDFVLFTVCKLQQ